MAMKMRKANELGCHALGVYIAVPTAFSALTIWSWALFKQGKWKEKRV